MVLVVGMVLMEEFVSGAAMSFFVVDLKKKDMILVKVSVA